MLRNDYYESIIFSGGKKIIVSRRVDASYMDKLHWHPFVEILLSLSDANEINVNFTNYTLDLNDIAIIYPGDLHSIRAVAERSMLVVQFSFELYSIMSELRNSSAMFFQSPLIKYTPSHAESDRMIALIKELISVSEADAPFMEVRMYAKLLDFFQMVGQRCIMASEDSANGAPSTECKATKQMAEACLYISHNCTKPLTLDDISAHMGISRSYFSHLFKRYTNMTFVNFLTAERVKRAQAMFSDPNALIIDIAFDSGFSSISTFNRAFKKITGFSPSRFRETMIN